ncbi:MAG: excinuclease ABC subunit UvrC [Bacilli bacterium]|jgi:excinuclease ABC subunit C|nr:excinuclease ABC subunit UvrC [Bacilli bacterium]
MIINNKIAGILKTLPMEPGCYLMKNKLNNIIYVGKAKNLKTRVNSYFNKAHNGKTQLLVSEITDIEFIITSNEKESLILEINLIKKYRPKYNIIFMDDKYYPYISITKEKHPRLRISRNTKNKKAFHYGPYPHSGAAWDTLNILNKLYKLRKCQKLPQKECLYYHLDQCLAPCIKDIDEKSYDDIIKQIKSFLNGNINDVIKDLELRMHNASDCLNFEKALDYKKLIDSIKITTNKQRVFQKDLKDRDYIGIVYNNDYISIQILIVRNGILIERKGDVFEIIDDVNNTIETYLLQYYELNNIPAEVIIDDQFINDNLCDLLENKIRVVKIGEHKKMLALACQNAQKLLNQKYDMVINNDHKIKVALDTLQDLIKVNSLHRIEAFDNSNLMGTNAIGAMVVFEEGYPIKSEYRKFKIKNLDLKDDYHYMEEVIYRRYYRVLMENLKQPDLIIVDGGEPQVNITCKVLKQLNLTIKVIGLAKDEKHNTSYLVDDTQGKILIDKKSPLFFFLFNIQNEVHNYAINFHRKLRSKNVYASVFDEVAGIGNIRAKKLIKEFKNIENLTNVSLEELENYLPKKVAQELYHKLHSLKNN